jgi:hypothetical protein
MPKSKQARAMICALTVVALFGTVQSGVAKTRPIYNQARPTYDQAWALCIKHLDQAGVRKDASARYSAGAACMLHYGYRI